MYPDPVARAGNPVSAPGAAVNRCRFEGKRRFHDKMEPAIRPDQQSEVLMFAVRRRYRNVEDPLRVFEKAIHSLKLIGRFRPFLSLVRRK